MLQSENSCTKGGISQLFAASCHLQGLTYTLAQSAAFETSLCACSVTRLQLNGKNSPSPRRCEPVSASLLYPLSKFCLQRGKKREKNRRVHKQPVLYSPFWNKTTKQKGFRRHPAAPEKCIPATGDNPPSCIPIAEHWSCGRSASPLRLSPPVASQSSWQQQRGCGCAGARAHTGGDYMHQLLDWLQCTALEDRRQAQVSQT